MKYKIEVPKKLRPFEYHGVQFHTESDDEFIGICPFCTGRKLYINRKTTQYSCKHCGKTGNLSTFLKDIVDMHLEDTTIKHYRSLSKLRGLPVKVLKKFHLAYDTVNNRWLLPCQSINGTVRDVRIWNSKTRKLLCTRGCKSQLYNAVAFNPSTSTSTLSNSGMDIGIVWIVEGEWDVLALDYLLQKAGPKRHLDIVVGLPGGEVFKDEWVEYFHNHRVRVCLDNDSVGDRGAEKIRQRIGGSVHNIKYLCWPDNRKKGYDIRDFVVGVFDRRVRPVTALRQLRRLMEPAPRHGTTEGPVEGPTDTADATVPGSSPTSTSSTPSTPSTPTRRFDVIPKAKRPSFNDVIKILSKHIEVDDELIKTLQYILAIIFSQQMSGNPLWGYVIGPPGSGKTLLLNMTSTSDRTLFKSSIGPHNLISGFRAKYDPSLISNVNGLVLIIKDGTQLLTQPLLVKQEIFSILRDAYDGSVHRQFGNGVIREYLDLRFSVCIGVTPIVNGMSEATLGDRFVKFQIRSLGDSNMEDRVGSAIDVVSGVEIERKIQFECNDVIRKFLAHRVRHFPTVPLWARRKLIPLCMLIAALRSNVDKDWRTGELLYEPEIEYGTRIAKQLTKLLRAISVISGEKSISVNSYAFVERVAYDTSIRYHFDIVATIISLGNRVNKGEITEVLGIPSTTLYRHLEDMLALKILHRVRDTLTGGGRPGYLWSVTKRIRSLWKRCKPALSGRYFNDGDVHRTGK